MAQTRSTSTRPPRKGVQLRLTEDEHRLLRLAAEFHRQTISGFVAVVAAKEARKLGKELSEAS